MQFTKLLVATAAFAVASAQTYKFTDSSFSGITVGQAFNITWEPATDAVTIKLKTGPSTAQILVSTIVSGAVGGSFQWIPTADTVPGQMYNLELDHGSDPPNYSVQFTITGGSGTTSSITSVVSSTATGSSATGSASGSTSSGTESSGASSTGSSAPSSTGSASGSSKPTKATSTASKASTSTSSSSSTTPTTNAAVQYASPFAFTLLSFFAIAVLN